MEEGLQPWGGMTVGGRGGGGLRRRGRRSFFSFLVIVVFAPPDSGRAVVPVRHRNNVDGHWRERGGGMDVVHVAVVDLCELMVAAIFGHNQQSN
jgi:hypothetical protein